MAESNSQTKADLKDRAPVTVSVILPAYNRPDALPHAINSVLSQSFRDLELIVVDDASSVNIEDVVKAINDPRLRYIRRSTNGGASAARNTGLDAARGEFISFQDSDDLWLPDKLERQIKLLEDLPNDVGAVCGGLIIYGRDSTHRFGPGKACYTPPPKGLLRLDEDQQKKLLFRNRLSLPSALFRRTCYPDAHWFDENLRANVDWDFAVRLAGQTKIYEALEPFMVVFKLGDNISQNKRQAILSRARIIKKNRQLFETHPREYGQSLYRLGTMLFRRGKRKTGLKFIIQGIWLNPRNICIAVISRMRGRR